MANFVFTYSAPSGTDGGPISITKVTSAMQIAPDSVRFGVDLSSANFTTAGPSGNEVYDARMHDLVYIWDLSDVGSWTAPVNVMAEWKDYSTAKGPFITHCFRDPDTYTIGVLVIEPSTGKWASAETTHTVGDPDAFYSGTATICVVPTVGGSFTGKPTGAVEVTSDTINVSQSWWTTNVQPTGKKRVLFMRGGEWDNVNIVLSSLEDAGMTFGAFGSGADPILNVAQTGNVSSGSGIYFNGSHGSELGTEPPELRVLGIDWRGNSDPTSESVYVATGKAISAVFAQSDGDIVVQDCTLHAFKGPSLYIDVVDGDPVAAPNPLKCKAHYDNCIFTDMGGEYPLAFFNGRHGDSCHSVTGCRMAQNPQAVSGDGATKSLIRSSSGPLEGDGVGGYFHSRGTDYFITDNRQAIIMAINTPKGDGRFVNIHSCSFEGGNCAVNCGTNVAVAPRLNRFSAHNVIIDGCVHLGGFNTQQSFGGGTCGGVTVRNCLAVIANVPRGTGTQQNGYDGILLMDSDSGLDAFDVDIVGAAPNNVYNCTMRYDRNSTNQTTGPAGVTKSNMVNQSITINEANNVHHAPNQSSPVTTFAPVTDTELWSPRCLGKKLTSAADGFDAYEMDTSQANPSGSLKATSLGTGSSGLLAATTGNRAWFDVVGDAKRTGHGAYSVGTIDVGAWQVSV